MESTGVTTPAVSILQNSIHDYQKGGIVAYGDGLTASVEYNTIQGIGPTPLIAQNGIEVDNGTGPIMGNTVRQNIYTGPEYVVACDLLLFADGLSVTKNTASEGDVGIYSLGNAATISGNTVSSTTVNGGGIVFADGSATDNTVTNSNYDAFEYLGSANASLTNNTIIEANIGISNDDNSTLMTTGTKYYDVITPVFIPPPTGRAITRLRPSPAKSM